MLASYLFSSSVELVYAFDVDYIHDPATVPEQFTRMLHSFPQQVIKVNFQEALSLRNRILQSVSENFISSMRGLTCS